MVLKIGKSLRVFIRIISRVQRAARVEVGIEAICGLLRSSNYLPKELHNATRRDCTAYIDSVQYILPYLMIEDSS